MTNWQPFDDGQSIGETGSECGRIVRDEEHERGARITLEEGGVTAPWSITCGVYGWMVHTRFFSQREHAEAAIDPMKSAMDEVLAEASRIAGDDEDEAGYWRVAALCSAFVERFPTGGP